MSFRGTVGIWTSSGRLGEGDYALSTRRPRRPLAVSIGMEIDEDGDRREVQVRT